MATLRESLRPYYHRYIRKPFIRGSSSVLQRMPFSSEMMGPPKGVVESTSEWAARSGDGQYGVTYIPVHPAERLVLSPSGTAEQSGNFFRFYNTGKDSPGIQWDDRGRPFTILPQTFVAELPNGRAWGQDGAIITPDDLLLGDLSPEYTRQRYIAGKHTALSQLRLPAVHHEHGTVAVLTTLSQSFFAHWMLDLLPRARLLELAGYSLQDIDKFYMPAPVFGHQRETLAAFGIPERKIIDFATHPHLKADRLIVASPVPNVFAASRFSCELLREVFLREAAMEQPDTPKRVYISRANASHRRVVNETAVIAALAPFAFAVIEPQLLSVREQAPLFSRAEAIVAPLGSAMANLVYCAPGTTLIEFLNPRSVQICSWAVCSQRNMNYHFNFARGTNACDSETREDIEVDVDELLHTLRLAGLRRGAPR